MEGQSLMTNVKSSVFGRGAIDGIAPRLGQFVVCTMDIPWSVVRDRLGGIPLMVVMVQSMEETVLLSQLGTVPDCDTFVGIGGGQAVDLAKYFAWKTGSRLVTIPTVLTVDAFVTPSAGIRRGSEVVYVGATSPDPLVIDYDIIRTAPIELNVAGVGDLLSIHTATYDWSLANERGKSEYPFLPEAIVQARALLSEVMSKTDDIRRVTDKGIECIVRGYMEVNTLCLPVDHYRVEEGSEHYIFYALEKKYQRPFIHGHVIGLGIYLMSKLQKNNLKMVTEFMDSVGLCYQPVNLGLTKEGLKEVLLGLKAFVASRSDLWYTVINESEFSEELVEQLMEGLKFADES